MIDSLIQSGDLDPAVRAKLTPLKVGQTLTWTAAAVTPAASYPDHVRGLIVGCVTQTNLNVQADKFPAATRSKCQP